MPKNKTILYILWILTIMFLGVLVFGVYIIRAENQNISVLQNQADEATNESSIAGSIRSIKNNYSKELKEITALLIHGDDLVPFIDSVEKLGRDVGLTTKIISVVQDKSNSKEIKYPIIVHITVESEGSWGNNMKFLSAIENLPTNISIENTNLVLNDSTVEAGKTTKPSEKVWHTNITFSILNFK
ncbi:MAG: hypothetical protein WAV25_01030 [Minisyncoccia bacterium]